MHVEGKYVMTSVRGEYVSSSEGDGEARGECVRGGRSMRV